MIGLAVALLLGGFGCSSDGDDAATATTTGGAAPDGERIYLQTCASCHGEDLRGTEHGPSQLSEVYEPGHHSDESYRSAIEFGSAQHHWAFGDMPPISFLDDAEIDAVIAYIREQQAEHGFEPYPPD